MTLTDTLLNDSRAVDRAGGRPAAHPGEAPVGRTPSPADTPLDFREQALTLPCGDDALQAVLATPGPRRAVAGTGVVIVVGGPQYRAGSHRQFVLLARALAADGFAVLRFDCRGMGDSSGERRGFEAIGDDIAAAVDGLLRNVPAVSRVVLWGLCDGAAASLLYCGDRSDGRVTGLCLLNPWVRSDSTLARTHVKHYYARRLLQREFWLKLLRGRVAIAALTGFARNLRITMTAARSGDTTASRPFHDRMALAWHRFDGELLLLLSDADLTAREFVERVGVDPAWRGAFGRAGLERHDVADADHTFSSAALRGRVETRVADWLRRHEAGRP